MASVFPRKSVILSPPGNHHESVNAHLLITHYVWKAGQSSLFYPRYSFENNADQNLPVFGGIQDKDGNYYYVSYPPGIFIFSSLYLQFVPNTYISLRYLSLTIQFVTAIALFLFLSAIFNAPSFKPILFLSTGLFLFTTGNLWLYSYFFFADTLVLPFLLLSGYFLIKIYNSDGNQTKYIFLYSLFLCLCCLTEWISVFFIASAVIFILTQRISLAVRLRHILITVIPLLLIIISYLLYSRISGMHELSDALRSKLAARSGFSMTHEMWFKSNLLSFTSHKIYMNSFLKNHLLLFQFTLIFAFLYLISFFTINKKSSKNKGTSNFRAALFMFILPTLLHYAVFTNFSIIHEFSQIKFSIILCIFICFLLVHINKKLITLISPFKLKMVCSLSLIIFAGISFGYLDNLLKRKPNHSQKIRALTDCIKKNCSKQTLICVKDNFYPEVAFNTKRIYLPVKDITNAQQEVNQRNIPYCIFIYTDSLRPHEFLFKSLR